MKHKKLCLLVFLFTLASQAYATSQEAVHKKTAVIYNGQNAFNERYYWFKVNYSEKYENELTEKAGGSYPPYAKMRHIVTSEKGLVSFDVFYDLDEYGQRFFDNSKYPGEKKQHLIIGGDSNSFGVGVSIENTIPALLAKKYPQYNLYNFSRAGCGPNSTLALMMNFSWENHISPSVGKMVYIFYLEWMTMRAVGTKNYLNEVTVSDPWFELVHDELVLKGQFKDRWMTRVFNFINFIDRFHWVGDLPKFTPEHMKFTAKIFEKMKMEYLNKFPKGEFILAVSEYNSHMSPQLVQSFLDELKKVRVETVVIQKNLKWVNAYHLLDSHFNVEGQKSVESELSKAIHFSIED